MIHMQCTILQGYGDLFLGLIAGITKLILNGTPSECVGN